MRTKVIQRAEDVEIVLRHKAATGSVDLGLNLLAIGVMKVSPMEGAQLWRRLRAEGIRCTLQLYTDHCVGFQHNGTLVKWEASELR